MLGREVCIELVHIGTVRGLILDDERADTEVVGGLRKKLAFQVSGSGKREFGRSISNSCLWQ